MRKLVAMREADLAHQKASLAAGAGNVHIADAEAALAEAKIRLAERDASLGKAGKGELLDRLTDELTMVSVDATDVEIRLNQVQSELKLYSLDKMDPANLEQLVKRDPVLGFSSNNSAAYELRDKLRAEYEDIYRQRFALKATGVTVTAANPISVASRSSRGGRGVPTTQR
jgi:hypothetical protein